MKEKIVLTKGKIEELEKELKLLEGKKKKELGKTLEQARLSDVSEDTDAVIAVMGDIEKVDLRISEIKEILENAQVLSKKGCSTNKVQVGSDVKVKSKGKTTTFSIVSEVESDPSANKISDNSPLGKALLKAKKGETVKFQINEKNVEYEVIDIC